MILLKLAYRNLIGAGVRTWLNVIVLSFSFVVIIWTQGLYDGMYDQAMHAKTDWEIGGGEFWHKNYDPYDPLSLEKSHGILPESLQELVREGKATPILITQATMYPDGRLMPVLLKGIDPDQRILKMPAKALKDSAACCDLPALIGERMASRSRLKKGDFLTLRWQDVYGAFDVMDARIVCLMRTPVSTIDNGQIWVPLDSLRRMLRAPGQTTIVVLAPGVEPPPAVPGWEFRSPDFLLSDIREIVQTKSVSSAIFYFFLVVLALLAIFDTQVLSIFRRRKEIGTLMALGMTRSEVIRLFTIEGAFHGILALLVAAIYGTPILIYFKNNGIPLPSYTDSYGIALSQKLMPTYGIGLILGTVFVILITVTVVSFLPTRRIARLKPTDALRGKWS
ncbi:MAG: ABC transporter permease [Calditrichaeota bacterium]|nr:ABC transporter permease [Calditrichota bacterium]